MPGVPYVVGQWVRGPRFYGRAGLLAEVLDGPRNCVWLLGTRRIGKTSTLKQLELLASEEARPRYFPVFWDLQGADSTEELFRSWRDAILDAGERLDAIGLAESEVLGEDLFESLTRLRRKLGSKGRRALLLCDEVEELLSLHGSDPGLLARLRRTLQSGEEIRAVLASTIRLWALAEQRGNTSPFLHGFSPPLYLRGLGEEEARGLVRQENLPSEERPILPESLVESIRSRCDNHPYLMQLVSKRFLELGDLDEAIEQVASDQMISYFFGVDFEMLSLRERTIIRILVEATEADSDSILRRLPRDAGSLTGTLLRLEQLGYVRRNAGGRYELVNYFFRRWFLASPGRGAEDEATWAAGPAADASVQATQGLDSGEDLFDGRYRIESELGRGAMGVVHRAHDLVLGEEIALKILRPEFAGNPEVLERFRREILLVRDLVHPNILNVYHMGEAGGQRFIAMRLVDGTTLARRIKGEGPLALDLICEIVKKLASALVAIHGAGIVHRDIKPSNVLLSRVGEPYLTDFGLACRLSAPRVTFTGTFIGTPLYASPEQAGRRPLDGRSDIYSLGVVLWEMATGRALFQAETSEELLDMHLREPVKDPRTHRQDLPDGLAGVIMKCLEKDPRRRYQKASNLCEELSGL